MKKLYVVLTILFLNNYIYSQTTKYKNVEFKTDQQKSEFILYLAKNYCVDAYSILKYEDKINSYTRYADGKSHESILKSYGTVIHESCHGANYEVSNKAQSFDYYGYFVKEKVEIIVPKTQIFNSFEIDKIVPDSVKTKIFRYKTYVYGDTKFDRKFLSSIASGIYGMLNEFTAYHHGLKATIDIYDYYVDVFGYEDYKTILDVFTTSQSEVYAYHEFRLFMAWYLKYAHQYEPDIYKSIIDNQNFKVAYTLINTYYMHTLDDFFQLRVKYAQEVNKLNNEKVSITEKGSIKFSKDNYSSSVGGPDETIRYLESLMTDELIEYLNKITIAELNFENYKSYIK